MSEHSNLPHDLPEYAPNWPVPARVKARVYRCPAGWVWGHSCPVPGRWMTTGLPKTTQPEAFALALKHAQGCW